mmetsp:Transcript_25687/g.52678  ORF Transcript_25687/g.52678 Transcript_25687/m.52678 type:complete len:266 (+) Transcript_25687:102-899(+)
MDDSFFDNLLDDALEETTGWGDPSKVTDAADDTGGNDDMYGDGDIDLDALLDDATEDVFANTPPPAVVPPVSSSSARPPVSNTQAPTTAVSLPSNPMSRTLLNAGLPPALAARWAATMTGDQAVQVRAQSQKPFSRAYKAWSESGYAAAKDGKAAEDDGEPEEGGEKAASGGWSNSAANRAVSLFGDTLQVATTNAKFKSAAKANSVTAALHGKDADGELVAALQKLYVDQVIRDSVPRLRTDTDRMAATSQEGRFPHIQVLLRS